MTFDDVKKVLAIMIITVICQICVRRINIKREMRGRQVLVSLCSPVIVLATVVWAYYKFDTFVISSLNDFFDGMVIVWNLIIVGVFLVYKIVFDPIMRGIMSSNELMAVTSDRFYEYNRDLNKWFLKLSYKNMRETANVLSWVMAAVASFILAVDWVLGKQSDWYLEVFPYAAMILTTEVYNLLNGYTWPEYERNITGEGISAHNRSAYYKLRRVYEELLPSALLVSHTGNEYLGKEGSTNLLEDLCKSQDVIDREVGKYFLSLDKKKGSFDTDMIKVTEHMMRGKSVIICSPFYRDLSDYLLLSIVSTSIFDKKCLVITGRGPSKDDIKKWMDSILYNYGRNSKLWRAELLGDTRKNCEIGILSFQQIYDIKVLKANREFLYDVGFILLIEPSRMLATGQIGLNIIAEYTSKNNKPVLCAIDRDVDGIVDTLSHVFKTNITEVVAAPVPKSVYTTMAWDAKGDFKRQKMFNKETRYLGDGIELAAIALKNQIKHVSWYSAEKAPIEDIKWIAGQYYPNITKYANLTNQQYSINDRLSYKTNLWGSSARTEEFVIAEDEFCNVFEMLRMYLSRGTVQSFVNVISENYLLRDYMRFNRQLFMTDAKAIPTICSGYSKTERNVILKLLLMMADAPVDEDVIAHELELLDINCDDVYSELVRMVNKYTGIVDTLITVKNRQLPGDDLLPKRKREYFITQETFDRYFASTIKNAYFIVEDENDNKEIIDAKLFGHITQLVMPKQIIVHDGKAYRVIRCTPKIGCVLNRASDSYNERLYYKQLRKYHMKHMNNVISSRTIYDIGISFESWDFSVETNGYLELKDNNDLRTARIVDLKDDPSISNYYRSYVNKNVLKLSVPDTTADVRFTIAILISELFRTLFPDTWQYIAVLSDLDCDKEGMIERYNYHVDGDIEEKAIYIVEDSEIDLGILEAVDNNIVRILETLEDYLEWHFEKIKEPPMKDPVLDKIVLDEENIKIKERLKDKIARRFKKFFGVTDEKKVKKIDDDGASPLTDSENIEPVKVDLNSEEVKKEEIKDDLPDEEEKTSDVKKTDNELKEDFNVYSDGEEKDEHIGLGHDKNILEEDGTSNRGKIEVLIDSNEIIVADGDDDKIAITDEIPNEIDIVMPVEPSRYQQECYLNFGYDNVDRVMRIDRVRAYLGSRGLGNNSLTKARKRSRFEDNILNFDAENCCDFCGKPLSGVSYDVLADGRIRCNDCSTTAIRDLKEFIEIYSHTEMMMENVFEINYPIAIAIKTVDAIKMSKHAHSVYQPSKQFAARVLGFAQYKSGEYTIFIENGSPRLVALNVIAHEMTHIWQYINWNRAQIEAIYKQDRPDRDKVALDIVYEGMAVWASIQILYSMGEVYFAEQQEQEYVMFNGIDKDQILVRRQDAYGYGYYLYRSRFFMEINGDVPPFSPFKYFPPLDPVKVRAAVLLLCPDEK